MWLIKVLKSHDLQNFVYANDIYINVKHVIQNQSFTLKSDNWFQPSQRCCMI